MNQLNFRKHESVKDVWNYNADLGKLRIAIRHDLVFKIAYVSIFNPFTMKVLFAKGGFRDFDAALAEAVKFLKLNVK
jgi:hypothetical protein